MDFSIFNGEIDGSKTSVEQKNTDDKDIYIRGKTIVFDADTKIVLKSGNACATLTAENGNFSLKGENIESSANLNNRIKGASVSLN